MDTFIVARGVLSRVARVFLLQHNKAAKMYQMVIKYTKRHIPTYIFHCKTLKYISSGNHGKQDFKYDHLAGGGLSSQQEKQVNPQKR
jgi:hypothetical protein